MELKKLTGEEVLAILEENFEDQVDDFAYNELGELIPEDFVFSDEVERIAKIKEEAYNKYSESDRDSDERDALWETYRNLESATDRQVEEYFNHLGLGRVVEVEQKGGMDEGSNWYSVKHFVDHDVYIKTTGYYQSHHGTDFYDGIGSVVSPQQKTVTVFE